MLIRLVPIVREQGKLGVRCVTGLKHIIKRHATVVVAREIKVHVFVAEEKDISQKVAEVALEVGSNPTPSNPTPDNTSTIITAIDAESFPDDVFREYVSSTFDTDRNGCLSSSEIASATSIYVDNKGISSLKGIEYFTALLNLKCNNNRLTTLDVSKCTKLYWLYCYDNQLTELDVNGCTDLAFLYCYNNQLTELYVSHNTALYKLNCSNNKLTSLNVKGCTRLQELKCYNNQLTSLYLRDKDTDKPLYYAILYPDLLDYIDCDNNQLTTLDVSGCTQLKTLYCRYNQLTTLDVSGSTKLETLYCNSNQLTYINIIDCPKLTTFSYDDGVLIIRSSTEIPVAEINANNFPDDRFRKYVNSQCDTDGNGYLSVEEVTSVAAIYVASNGISSLKGLEFFTALTELRCFNNHLTALDVSHNTALTKLVCSNNQLTALDVSHNTALTELWCDDNQLKTLDVSKNTALTELWCHYNQLIELDVNNNTALTLLSCSNNHLTTLDVSNNTVLTDLDCSSNELTELDVGLNTALTYLDCSYNKLTALDLSKNTSLAMLYCEHNQLIKLDVSKNTALVYLQCDNNKLTNLTLGNNFVLATLKCKNNSLTQIDISGCPKLSSGTFTHDSIVSVIDSNSALRITTSSLASGTVNTPYSDTLTAQLSGGSYAITWAATGLPSWLTLNSSTGALTGTPTSEGSYTFIVTAYAGQFSSSPKEFSIQIGRSEIEMPDAGTQPEFTLHQPRLGAQILLDFFVDFAGNSPENSFVDFKVLNNTAYNPTQEFNPELSMQSGGITHYGFRCSLTSIQMADPITAILTYGNGQKVTHNYALTDYINKFYKSPAASAALKNLLAAMLDYGHYAQISLAATNGWRIGTDHIATDCANVYTDANIEEARQAVSSYTIVRDTGTSGIRSVTFSLELASDTTLNLKIWPASDYSGSVSAYSRGVLNITDTNANLAVKQSEGYYLVKISEIPAHRLDYTNTIRVITDRGSFDIKASALSYVNAVLNGSFDTDTKKAVTALYRYYKTTIEYRRSIGM